MLSSMMLVRRIIGVRFPSADDELPVRERETIKRARSRRLGTHADHQLIVGDRPRARIKWPEWAGLRMPLIHRIRRSHTFSMSRTSSFRRHENPSAPGWASASGFGDTDRSPLNDDRWADRDPLACLCSSLGHASDWNFVSFSRTPTMPGTNLDERGRVPSNEVLSGILTRNWWAANATARFAANTPEIASRTITRVDLEAAVTGASLLAMIAARRASSALERTSLSQSMASLNVIDARPPLDSSQAA